MGSPRLAPCPACCPQAAFTKWRDDDDLGETRWLNMKKMTTPMKQVLALCENAACGRTPGGVSQRLALQAPMEDVTKQFTCAYAPPTPPPPPPRAAAPLAAAAAASADAPLPVPGAASSCRSFHGFPINQTFTSKEAIKRYLWGTDSHENRNPEAQFALAVEVEIYPNNVKSVWVLCLSLVSRR